MFNQNKKEQQRNIFSPTDHMIVRSAVRGLPGLLSQVMIMRFWENRSIVEIADDMGVTVKTIELAILKSFRILRDECLRNPTFSRSLHYEIRRFGNKLAA
jgi:DNA-directed RNA polymerase specialized sigma24 family protein